MWVKRTLEFFIRKNYSLNQFHYMGICSSLRLVELEGGFVLLLKT